MNLQGILINKIEKDALLVFTLPRGTTNQEFDNIFKELKKQIPDRHIVVIPEQIKLEVLTTTDLENIGLKKIEA